ncbi:MAG: glutamine-hydrolyzing GMP synthase, partial [Acidimicrobiia bacterium]
MPDKGFDSVVVVDFGAQYAQLIARRVREADVHSEIVPRDITAAQVAARAPVGVSLSGGPASVYATDAYELDPGVFDLGIPVLGICYGHQVMSHLLGGAVEPTDTAEYGRTELEVVAAVGVFTDLPEHQNVWMSHRDAVVDAPPGFMVTARTAASPVAAMEDAGRRFVGVQFHPEVGHTDSGREILRHFLYDQCGARAEWTSVSIIEQSVEAVRAEVGGGKAVCGLSGGVDSAVAAALVHRAVGD